MANDSKTVKTVSCSIGCLFILIALAVIVLIIGGAIYLLKH